MAAMMKLNWHYINDSKNKSTIIPNTACFNFSSRAGSMDKSASEREKEREREGERERERERKRESERGGRS